MDLNDYCDRAHETSRLKGWWDEGERNDGELLALMHSELSELHTADPRESAEKCPEISEVEEEAADFAIRLFDYCAARCVDLQRGFLWALHNGRVEFGVFGTQAMISELHVEVSNILEALRKGQPVEQFCGVLWAKLCIFATEHGIRLQYAIDQKMAFNLTRPHRHGGKKF